MEREARARPEEPYTTFKDLCLFLKSNKKLLINFKEEKFVQSM